MNIRQKQAQILDAFG